MVKGLQITNNTAQNIDSDLNATIESLGFLFIIFKNSCSKFFETEQELKFLIDSLPEY